MIDDLGDLSLKVAQFELAAKRLTDWDLARHWRDHLALGANHGVAAVQWNTGCRMPGYDLVRAEVTDIVSERLAEIVIEALERIEMRARRAVDSATEKAGRA